MPPPIDWLNVSVLMGIFVLNVVSGFAINYKAGNGESGKDLLWAHGSWTACWAVWLFAWFGLYKQWDPRLTDFLNDLGAICLIVFAAALTGGRTRLRTLWIHFVLLVVAFGIYVFVISAALNWAWPSNGTPGYPMAADLIVNRTILFAPSLCLVIFGFGFLAAAFFSRVGVWESTLIATMAIVYSLLHIPLAQVFDFVPGLELPHWWRAVFLSWRVGFVVLYWLVILAYAGLRIPFEKILQAVAAGGSVLASMLKLLRK